MKTAKDVTMLTGNRILAVLLLIGATALTACTESLLEVDPVDQIPADRAIVDQASALASLAGAYSGLQLSSYYGIDFVIWPETLTGNAEHTGTFEEFADADLLFLRSDIGAIEGMWEDIYDAIYRVNLLIQAVPTIDASRIQPDVTASILGQSHGLRALHYFNLVRGWGGVPLVLQPLTLPQAAEVTRADATAVYDQVDADLGQAETLLDQAGVDNSDRTFLTPGFVDALQAKVALYRNDYATAEAEAREVVGSGDYGLASAYGDLFTADGAPTDEDVFRLVFTATDANSLGHYYQFDGRFEVGATQEIYDAYAAGDARFDVIFEGVRPDGIEVTKYPTTIGAEDFHVIRYADVLLILAEALAQQNGAGDLAEAVNYLNDVRGRANVGAFAYVPGVSTQQEVLDAIYAERRLEFAFEGDYWFDLVRTGRAAAALGANFDAHESLWPLPQSELDVASGLTQNPGY